MIIEGAKQPLLHRLMRSPAVVVLVLNAIIAGLWGGGYLLGREGAIFVAALFGGVALLAPAICLTLALEQISEETIEPLSFSLWVMLFTVILTPSVVLLLSHYILKAPPVSDVVHPFIIWWAMCLVATFVIALIKQRPISILPRFAETRTKREVLAIISAFSVIMLINLIIYPLLPEGDGYALLVKWEAIRLDPRLLAAETRVPFLVFINLVTQLARLDPYWVLKAVLPLSHFTLVVSCYLFARRFIADSRTRILMSLSPLFFPIILQEILINRPQSIFLISLLPCLVLTSETFSKTTNIRRVYWLFTLLALAAIGIKIHTLFALVAMTGMLALIAFLWPHIRKRPLDAVMIVLVLLILLSPQLVSNRLIFDAWRVVKLFSAAFGSGTFRLWFIDHYRNVDGIEVGWPGISSLFYYGYNLGLIFPIVLVWFLAAKKWGTLKQLMTKPYWAMVFLFVFAFFIAEIAPRFGIAYLPDRAWLLIAAILALVLPFMVSQLAQPPKHVRPLAILLVLSLVTLTAGTGLTYAKQGWVVPAEVEAAVFIRTQTPPNAIFFGQGSGRVMIRYYGKRVFVHGKTEPIFLTGDKKVLDDYIKNQEDAYATALSRLPQQRADLSSRLQEMASALIQPDISNTQIAQYLDALSIISQERDRYRIDLDKIREAYPTANPDAPIYLAYNRNKFNSLYGQRSWWRISNFYGANIAGLTASYPVVYDKNGVIIWQARK